MVGEQRETLLIHLDAVVHHEALPPEINTQPHPKGPLLQHPFGVLEKTSQDPLAPLTQDL
jgi:hypothetical protein